MGVLPTCKKMKDLNAHFLTHQNGSNIIIEARKKIQKLKKIAIFHGYDRPNGDFSMGFPSHTTSKIEKLCFGFFRRTVATLKTRETP